MKWVAVRAAEQNFGEYESDLSHWQGFLPFFIRLRDYAAKGYELPTPDMLPIQLSSTRILADQLPKGWATKQLKLGRALILIDGLDEVNNEFRMKTIEWINDLIALYPTAHYLISSRSSAITYTTLNVLQSRNFARAYVQPLSLKTIEVLVDKWHEAVASQSALLTPKEQAELPILASELRNILSKDLPVQKLATNPLLCAMLCALHRDHNKKLPRDRIQLYQECIRMLLEGRDRQRDVDLQDYPHLEFRQKTTLLQYLAYWMTRNGLTTASRKETEERIQYKINYMPRLATEVTSSKVLNYLVDRSGLLREPTEESIDFAHRTFQEFFTAQEIVEQGDMRYLLEQVREKQWRETIILTAGLARPHDQEMLFAKLLEYGHPQDRSYYQLALSCLETVIQLSEKAIYEIQRHLGRLAPPKDENDARLFSLAGKLALPYLHYKEQYPLSSLIICIVTLGLIGGDEALGVLKGYVVESGRELACILGKVWNEFDTDLFFDQILQPSVDKWRYVCLYDVSHLEIVLQRLDFTRLQILDLVHCNVIDISNYLHLIPKHVFVREPRKSKENPKVTEQKVSSDKDVTDKLV